MTATTTTRRPRTNPHSRRAHKAQATAHKAQATTPIEILQQITDEMRIWIVTDNSAVRLHPDLAHYVRGLGITASGADTLDINDRTAERLRGLDLTDLYATVAEELEALGRGAASKGFLRAFGKDTPWESDNLHAYLHDKFWERNPGMQRMNLGNILRAAQRRATA
jgi:hypothetical protein